MTLPVVVALHGNPETPVIWEPLIAELGRLNPDRRVITPQLPGFGCVAPAGFGATKEEYAAWFAATLDMIVAEHGPVDLLGHDWGGGIAMRVVATHPHLVRSWTSDVLGLFHADYVWHDFAQIWYVIEGEFRMGARKYGPGTLVYMEDPHFEDEMKTETGGTVLFVQYPGPTTGARPIYDGRMNLKAPLPPEQIDLER